MKPRAGTVVLEPRPFTARDAESMTSERRYQEEEVDQIFERATRPEEGSTRRIDDEGAVSASSGITLSDLKRIGAEVGIPADRIESAARALDHRTESVGVNRRLFGLPVGLAAISDLPRRLTDEEWTRLVAMIRDEFSAHGELEETGALRSWRNGNLRVQLEPAGGAQKLRMQTYRQSARSMVQAGGAMLVTGVVLGALSVLSGDVQAALATFSMLSVFGAGMVGSATLGLRGWAERRREQMERIAARASQLASGSEGAHRGLLEGGAGAPAHESGDRSDA